MKKVLSLKKASKRMVNVTFRLLYTIIMVVVVSRLVSSCHDVFQTFPSVDVKDCLSICERDSRCATYYFKSSTSGKSTCALSEFGLKTKKNEGLASLLISVRDNEPWEDQTAQQIRPSLKDSKDCNQNKTSHRPSPGDFCVTGNHNCSVNANCTSVSPTTFNCTCVDGYQGDGVTCGRVCKWDWKMFNGSCYRLYTEIKNWNEALAFCKTKGANLASIVSLEENNFIHLLMRIVPANIAWIGLVRTGSPPSLSWSDGSSLGFHKWYPRQPNNSGNCVYIRMRDGKWKDNVCTASMAFLCKF